MAPLTSIKMRDITDGTSHTILVAEQSGLVNNSDLRANHRGGWTGQLAQNFSPVKVSGNQSYWGAGTTTLRYPINSFKNSSAPDSASNVFDANTIINSMHTGGLHVALGDGSVRFISENVNMATLYQLAIRNDGQVVGEY